MTGKHSRVSDAVTVVISRGVGYLALAAFLLIKNAHLSSGQMAEVGRNLAVAMAVISPFSAAASQIMLRRLVHTGRLNSEVRFAWMWIAAAALLLAIGATIHTMTSQGGSPMSRFTVACAFLMGHTLVGAMILWLRLSGQRRLLWQLVSLVFLCVSGTAAARLLLGARYHELDFAIEAGALLVSASLIMSRVSTKQTSRQATQPYPFTSASVMKYAAINVFYSGVLAVDWQIASATMAAADFAEWARLRLLMERFVLPILNAASSFLLIRLFRRKSRQSKFGSGYPVEPSASVNPRLPIVRPIALSIIATLSIFSGTLALKFADPIATTVTLLFVGYILFGIVSVLLDLFQAERSISAVCSLLLVTFILYSATSAAVMLKLGPLGAAALWCFANGVLLWVLYLHVRLQFHPK